MGSKVSLDKQISADEILSRVRENFCYGRLQLDSLTKEEIKLLKNRYSHYEDSSEDGFIADSKFCIDTVDLPKGWFHYMINLNRTVTPVAISVTGHDGAGVLSLNSVLFGPITKLSGNENYMHVSQVYRNTRNLWIKNEKGAVHLLNPQPNFYNSQGKPDFSNYNAYQCVNGLGYNTITSKRDGIDYNFRTFVPNKLPGEIWTVSVKNTSSDKKSFSLYPEINFGLDSHPSHYFVGMAVSEVEYDQLNNAIVAKNLDIKNSFPRWGAFIAGSEPLAFASNADTYYGFGACGAYPAAIFKDKLDNCEAKQPLKGMIGAFQYNIELKPGEEKTYHFAVASIDPNENVSSQVSDWKSILDDDGVEQEFQEISAQWQKITNSFLMSSPSEEIDRTFNIWGKYQGIICSRFNSPYDVGTRDMFQYLLANCVFEPDYVKEMIPYLLSYQYRDGRVPRQICKFSDMHDLRNFMDCQLWLPDLVDLYLCETGDFDILDKQVGFLEDDNTTLSEKDAQPVYEHLILTVKSGYENNIGEHGLCKLGYGGWNDALDGLRGDRSESVWLSQLLVYAAKKVLKIAEYKEDSKTAGYLNNIIENVSRAINEAGLDKEGYYIFGYANDGSLVGSSVNKEGKKHLNENSWALISGVADDDQIPQIIKAMDELKTPFGARLLTPYTKASAAHVGRIADQAQGHFENGSVYQHGALFWAHALLQKGYIDEAFEAFALLTNENRIPDITTNPTHYHSNYTAIPLNSDYGKEPYYPFTGSHAWRMRFITEVIGLNTDYNELVINPCIPSCWRDQVKDKELILKARKRSNRIDHHNIVYSLEVYRDDSLPKGNKWVFLNGSMVDFHSDKVSISFKNAVFDNMSDDEHVIDIKVYI